MEKKIKEGQLDECDLTLRQIEQIKEAFIPILNGIHHGRIEYPGETEKDKKTAREKTANTKKTDEQVDSQKIEPQTRAAEISNKK